jgi:hypothetical protein
MDQIVGQALTVYSKMNSVKRKDALVMVSGLAHSGKGNGNGNGHAKPSHTITTPPTAPARPSQPVSQT